MPRLLIASNRLPVTVRAADGKLSVERSAGGLATGMRGPHERLGGLWIGWPGELDGLDAAQRAEVDERLRSLRLAPVPLSREEIARYYEGYSNSVLWPLFHYEPARIPPEVRGFDAYQAVNEKFAEAIASRHEPGDLVWVHDYQLMLVPQLLRERLPDARIGFFLHIPFPSSELFRVLPERERILEGLLGADLIGFHTATFLRHFASSALRLLGLPTDVDRIRLGARDVILGVFPMGVDAAAFEKLGASEGVQRIVSEQRPTGERLLVGIDRLDYTKGIPRRLLAYDALLRAHPELRERISLVQLAAPSREHVKEYVEYRARVEELVGRIHGDYATPRWSPIHYLHRGVSQEQIVALYRAADAVLVTPERDGMNLVAKEFVASRVDGDGVLVLSELAGAAAELAEAVLVNPYDVERTAAALYRALVMPEDERRTRMAALRERVLGYDVHAWARAFVSRLERTRPSVAADLAPSPAATLRAAIDRAASASRLTLLLDYDGTLVPFAKTPELAAPDEDLLALLRRLATRPRTEVHLVSGRPRRTMDRWFGALPVGLHAEHGVWSRFPGAGWEGAPLPEMPWRDSVRAILRDFAERTPGSLVEEKTAGFAWHYRSADPEYGAAQAKDLSLHLATVLSNVPVELLPGDKVVEIRVHGINKGRIAAEVARRSPEGTLLLAMGDDRTDEDLFGGLPGGSLAVHVGPAPSRAPLRIPDVRAARRLLTAIADAR